MLRHQGFHLCDGVIELPGFSGQDNQIRFANRLWRVSCFRWIDGEIPVNGFDSQAFFADRFKVSTPGDEGNIFAIICETPAEISANAACTKDNDFNGRFPLT